MTEAVAPFRAMALNNAWANATLYRALGVLDADAFWAPRPGFFPSLARTLNHVFEVDLFYVDALMGGGRGRAVFDRADILEPAALGAEQAKVDMDLTTFCHQIGPEGLAERCETERRGGMVQERVDSVLLHLFQHQCHHRGQANVQLQAAGIEPPQLDEFHLEFMRAETAQAYFS